LLNASTWLHEPLDDLAFSGSLTNIRQQEWFDYVSSARCMKEPMVDESGSLTQ
jgi:hypothetical protein